MSKNQTPQRRKTYFINPKFQLKFILYTLVPNIFCLTLFYVMTDLYFLKLVHDGEALGLAANHPYFSLLNDQSALMNKVFIILSIVTTLFFIIWGILFSHKIAGPMLRLKNHMDNDAKTGKLNTLNFRPDDFFQEIPDSYNKLSEKSQKKGL